MPNLAVIGVLSRWYCGYLLILVGYAPKNWRFPRAAHNFAIDDTPRMDVFKMQASQFR